MFWGYPVVHYFRNWVFKSRLYNIAAFKRDAEAAQSNRSCRRSSRTVIWRKTNIKLRNAYVIVHGFHQGKRDRQKQQNFLAGCLSTQTSTKRSGVRSITREVKAKGPFFSRRLYFNHWKIAQRSNRHNFRGQIKQSFSWAVQKQIIDTDQ